MSRLQKKCFVASCALHGLLMAALFVGPAFLTSKPKPDDMPILEVIPARLIDAVGSGGGSPNAAAAAPKPVVTPPPPRPQPVTPATPPPVQQEQPQPKPEVAKETPKVKPEPKEEIEDPKEKLPPSEDPVPPKKRTPKKQPPKKQPEEETDKPEKEAKPEKHIIDRNTKTVKKVSPEAVAKQKEEEEAQARELARYEAAAQARRDAFSKSVGNLQHGLSTGTTVEMPGPGGGGEAFANYGQAVRSIYDRAWIVPGDLNDDSSSVKVQIVVNKDGTIVRARIQRPSGYAPLDRSVQNALDRVRSLPPFPEGATDPQRTFVINFNLKSKLRM